MALEPWGDVIKDGDVISKTALLDQIKANLTSVLSDYIGKGIENERQLIANVATLFTGEVVPARKDWDTLVEVLRILSTEKEQGVMYNRFILDVSDSLGVSDLLKIKNFIDYIQGLAPLSGSLTVSLEEPERYWLTVPLDTTSDSWDHATVSWGLSTNYLKTPNATIKINPSLSEDVLTYQLDISAGNFKKTVSIPASNVVQTTVPLLWTTWFTAEQLKSTYFNIELTTIDKRGNTALATSNNAYKSSVVIPQGIKSYELQYQIDGGAFAAIATTTAKSVYWDVPRVSGTYRYRVRGLDESGFQHGGITGTVFNDWSWGNPRYIKFIPLPPDKPNPKVTVTHIQATVTWDAVPRAEFYEVWHGAEKWAKDNTKGGNTYWERLKSTDSRNVVLKNYNEGENYTWHVRAINEGGSAIGSVNATMKVRPLRKATYKNFDAKVWRAPYDFKSQYGYITKNGASWRKENHLYQAEWKEDKWGNYSWAKRGGGTYWAHAYQAWGNNMSFLFFDYVKMREDLKGKNIQKVTVQLSRSSGGAALNAHGHKLATPLYLYNHNRDNSFSTTTTNAFSLFRADRARVNKNNQQAIVSAKFDRGETERFANNISKQLIQNIVDGHMRGLGIAKYYGDSFDTHGWTADPAYMLLSKNVYIDIEYYDN